MGYRNYLYEVARLLGEHIDENPPIPTEYMTNEQFIEWADLQLTQPL